MIRPAARTIHPATCHCWDCSDDPHLRARRTRRAAETPIRDWLSTRALAVLAAATLATTLLNR